MSTKEYLTALTDRKYRIHYMTATEVLVARWDSAPHYPLLPTFPFHKHTVQGVEAHAAVTLLDVLDEVIAQLTV